MPLVRYELRSEHSLANPELFRSAARDDPEGLLEGVAMAGLVGIVRQLGDLAEFAAEVFRDLHEEFVSVGGRAHDLTVRVQTLAAELPAVEKTLLSEPNQLRFAYTNGADWHASIRSDQNHCTSGDLPRFVRKYYQECRGPPRLFLLDKFDVVGAGACLKRYSDPSFFKLEWASSELMKAQRAQRDKKARREKKKGRRRKTGQPMPPIHQIPARVRYGSAALEDLDNLSQLLAPTLKNEVDLSSSNQSGRNGTQTQRKSNLGPQSGGSGYPPLPTAVSPARQAEGGASESLKPNAEDIEAKPSRIIHEPSEKEKAAESVGGKLSQLFDMEDHVAKPAVEPLSRDVEKMSRRADELPLSSSNVVADRTNQVVEESLKAAVARASVNTSRGKPGGDALHAGGKVPKLGNGSVSRSKLRNVFSKTSNEHHSKEDVTPSESRTPSSTVADDADPQEDPSRTNTGDVRGSGQLFGKAVRKNSVDAKEAHVIAARFPRQGSGKFSRGTNGLGNVVARDLAEHRIGNGSQRQSLAKHENPADGGHGVDRQPEHNASEASAGDGHVPTPVGKSERSLSSASAGGEPGFHDGRPSRSEFSTSNAVDTSEVSRSMEERINSPPRLPPIRIEEILVQRSVSSGSAGGDAGFHDGRPSRSEFFTSNAVDTGEVSRNMEGRINSPPHLPPVRIEEILVQREESPLISSQCSSPGPDDIRPSVSMLSRMSYSSELLGISSASDPDSPLSLNSPPFDPLYSPPGSPSRVLGGMAESPPGLYMGSYSPVAEPSGYRNSPSGIPLLSLSPRSSPTWADRGDFGSAPVRPPPPRPVVISMAERRGQVESRQEVRSLDSQPSHPTSPSIDLPTSSKADGVLSQSNEEPGHVASSEKTAEEVHAEPAGGSGDHVERVAHLEARPEHNDGMRSPDANSEAEGSFRSAASSPGMRGPLRSSIPSSFDNLDSGTTQPLSTSFVDLGPAESHSVDLPSEETTLRIDDSPPIPVGEDGAFTPSEPRVGSAADASSNAVPVQHAPSSSGQGMNGGVYSMFAEGEESEPSSPSGSVIIKDTPSPGSPTSDDSENEPEAHDYYASHGPVSPRSVAHALEDVINRRGTGSGDSSVHEDLIHEASESAPTNAASIQEGGIVNSIAEHVVQAACIAPEERVEAFVSHTSTELDNPQEAMSSQDPTSALDSIEATTLRAIVVNTADVQLHKRSASNSPLDTPPGKACIAGEDEASTLQWEGRSRPESPYGSESRVAPSSSGTSMTNSPPTSPPKLLEHARWRRRPNPASAEQDFSLLPNLGSETSSPPCSPPPASDLESPRQWDEVSESSTSSESTERSREEDDNVEVYPLPDSPAPPESPMMSEEGDSLSKRASDEDDDGAALEEVEMAETATGRTDAELPSAKPLQALPSALQVSDDVLPASEVQPTFQYSRPDLEVEHSQQSALENEWNYEVHETPPPAGAPESTDPPADALGSTTAQKNWIVVRMKAMSVQELDVGHSPFEGGQSEAIEGAEGKETLVRPASMINVAAILEKANAIRQAFVGSDDESDDEDEWNA